MSAQIKQMPLPVVEKLYFSPVKSLSFSPSKKLMIKKNIGIINDRIFAFTRIIGQTEAKDFEKNPIKRNLNFFLTLKNSPFLNKYNFEFKEEKISLLLNKKLIKKISISDNNNFKILSEELKKREKITKYYPYLIKNKNFPFFDTMPQNSISLINVNSIKDFEEKINYKIHHARFRGNIYINNIQPWSEFNLINKKVLINNCLFKVLNKIPRCSATNLAPNADKADINLPRKLRDTYNHSDMGIYLKPLTDGVIKIGNEIKISN